MLLYIKQDLILGNFSIDAAELRNILHRLPDLNALFPEQLRILRAAHILEHHALLVEARELALDLGQQPRKQPLILATKPRPQPLLARLIQPAHALRGHLLDELQKPPVVQRAQVEPLGHVQPLVEARLVLEVKFKTQLADPLLLLIGADFN